MKPVLPLFCMFLFFTAFSSCGKSEEIERYELSPEEVKVVPYTEGSTIPFKHSRGLEFSFVVQQRQTFWAQTDIRHTGDDYISYQIDETKITSLEPELEIRIAAYPWNFTPLLDISINRYNFKTNIQNDPELDSMIVNDKVYRNVYVVTGYAIDSGIIAPDSIFYTKKEGILKITMTNDEEYSLNL